MRRFIVALLASLAEIVSAQTYDPDSRVLSLPTVTVAGTAYADVLVRLLDFEVLSRGLIGYRNEFMTDTKGTIQQVGKGIDQGFKTVKSKTEEIAGGAKAKVNEVKTAASNTINKAKTGVTKAKDKVKGFVGGLFKKK